MSSPSTYQSIPATNAGSVSPPLPVLRTSLLSRRNVLSAFTATALVILLGFALAHSHVHAPSLNTKFVPFNRYSEPSFRSRSPVQASDVRAANVVSALGTCSFNYAPACCQMGSEKVNAHNPCICQATGGWVYSSGKCDSNRQLSAPLATTRNSPERGVIGAEISHSGHGARVAAADISCPDNEDLTCCQLGSDRLTFVNYCYCYRAGASFEAKGMCGDSNELMSRTNVAPGASTRSAPSEVRANFYSGARIAAAKTTCPEYYAPACCLIGSSEITTHNPCYCTSMGGTLYKKGSC